MKQSEFYLVRRGALPPVLRKVAQANRLLAQGSARTVNEAVEMTGISRSSYYKFKDDIKEFHDSFRETAMTLILEVLDEPGLLAEILRIVASGRANILTIYQSIPQNGVASVSISLQITSETEDVNAMIAELESSPGIRRVTVAGR